MFASTGGAGHFNPLLSIVDAVVRRGDEVTLVVPPTLEATVAATGHRFVLGGEASAEEAAALWERFPLVTPGEGAVIVNREIFGRLCTAAMLPAHERTCREWRPDLVVREPCEYGSAIAAERHGIPHVQVAISLAKVEAGAIALAAPVLAAYGETVVPALHAAPYLTRFPASLDPSPFAVTHRFREVSAPPAVPVSRWWGASEHPLVYVTFGSVAGGLGVGVPALRAVLDAVAGLEVRVLMTTGRRVESAALGAIPDNVHVEAWVPQADVLAEASVVVCHGGSGTTFGALAAGVPLVMVPLFADQPRNADLVARAGAGVVVEAPHGEGDRMRIVAPGESSRIASATTALLSDPSYRRAAKRLADEMSRMPSPDDLIGRLVRGRVNDGGT